jgi:hypothetical protein
MQPIRRESSSSNRSCCYNINQRNPIRSSWIYADADSDVVALTGKVASYMSSGYKVDLPTTKNQSLQILNDLRMHKWIDEYTRAVIVDFIMYNANINLFNQARSVAVLMTLLSLFV